LFNPTDYVRIGENGDPSVDFSNMTQEQATALSEFTAADFKIGRGKDARQVRRVRVKMHDKIRALIALGKHLGLFKK
jgi:phage terminase small subunit